MIRITQQASAKDAKRYYATADYYSEGQEIVGNWGGRGAVRLGLEGRVDKQSFERLCDNLHPQTGKPLTVRTRSDRTVGYDFTFSVPKSVALLYGLTGDRSLLDAFRSAVGETMQEMEAEMKTRVRKQGADTDRITGNMVWAEFIHTTSRPVDGVPDPGLHAHVFVVNATWSENRWQAGQFRDLKRDAPYFQAAFRVRLANRLQDTGFGIARKRDYFEIAGIAPDVLKRFSRRTNLIEKIAAERNITDPDEKAELGAVTREKKSKNLSTEELRREWRSRLTEEESDSIAAVHRRERLWLRPPSQERLAVDYAIEHSFVREAVVPERKLITEALKRGVGAVTVENVTAEMSHRPLIRSEIEGRPMATTEEMLKLESRLVQYAKNGRGRCLPLGDPNRPCSREWFTEGQKKAVRDVLGSRDRVTIIRGVAGTGKTTLEQEIGEALAEGGHPVIAIAQSVKASREVLREEAGFGENADTVARFLTDEDMQQKAANGGVILVDEASQLGTRDMLKILEIAEHANSRVVLVGDRKQHRSVAAGEPLKLLEERAGLRVSEVTEILRQQGSYKKAAQALSEGRTEAAFQELDKLGWIKELTAGDRYEELANAYLAAISEKKRGGKNKSALVVSPTHHEGAKVTEAIRDKLKARGTLKEERAVRAWVPMHLTDAQKADVTEYDPGVLIQFHQNAKGYTKGTRLIVEDEVQVPTELANRFEVYRPTELRLAVGDRIRVTAGGKTKDGKHRLNNGSLLTVTGFTARGDIITGNGRVIDAQLGVHLTHGYTITSHASQGVTVDKVFVAIASESLPATCERTAYVAITRGKEQAQIFTDDRSALLKAVKRLDEPLSATELAESSHAKPQGWNQLWKGLAAARSRARFNPQVVQAAPVKDGPQRGFDHDR